MDYEGQRLAEKCYQWIIVLFGVVGFIWGYFCQQYIQTVYVLGAGVLLATLVMNYCMLRHSATIIRLCHA
jgi:signal peptidase complex subunit 1